MLRPRLSHPLWVTLGIVSCLLASLAYFPFTQTMASPTAQVLLSAGKPLVHLKAPQAVSVNYAGSHNVASALQSGTPTAMAAADFDEDGAMDLATGYRTSGGGAIAILHGNPDALAPKDTSLYAKAMAGSVPPTFQSKAAVFALPVSPDFIATGDFDRDGHKDVLAAARGGALYLMNGDGKGNLAKPQLVQLLGGVTAMAAIADGHVAVATDGAGGPTVVILAPAASGLTATGTFPLTASATSMAWGALGEHTGPDLAVASGDNVVVIYHAFHSDAQTETVNVPFSIHALALGDFIWDQDGRTEMALLAEDGTIHILQHGILNTSPFTAAELKAHGALRGIKTKQQPNATGAGPWSLATKLSASVAATSGAGRSMMQSPRLTGAADLLVVDAAKNQLKIVDGTGKAASPETDIAFSSLPVAAAVMPQKLNGKRDLVVMTAGQTAPTIISEDSSGIDPTVNSTADADPQNACTNTAILATDLTGTITLREALCAAGNSFASGATGLVIVSLPPGTYTLTSLDTGELQVGPNGANVALVGTGTPGNTIIQQGDRVDRVFDLDPNATGANTESFSNVTIQNGVNNNPNNFSEDGGGGMIDGSSTGGSDSLTLTNVVLTNNNNNTAIVNFGGGGLAFAGDGSLTITNSTISNNTATQETGGGVEVGSGDPSLGDTFTFTNDVFTGNVSTATPPSSGNTPGDGGQGGALNLSIPVGDSATISSSTFTNNTAQDASAAAPGQGGAIFSGGTLTMTNSRIAGNHASEGSGFTDETTLGGGTVAIINNWWGCNGGPGAAGCDTVFEQSDTGSSVNPNPWLVLSITPTSSSPAQLLPGATTTLTADLTHNSSGTGGFSVPNGTPVSFGASLGTDNPTSTTLTSGKATSTYTAGSTAGNDTATATVDSQTVPSSPNINILDSVTVTTNIAGPSFSVDGAGPFTTAQTFNWVVGSSHTISTTSPQPAGAGSQYAFTTWSDGGAISHSITAPAAPTTFTANFTQQYQLTTQASPSADGSVTPASGQFFAMGATIPVTATANSGFQFNNWTSTGGSFDSTTSASTNFHMPAAPTTVTGNFVPATVQVTVTTSPANLLVSVDGGSFTAAPLVETWNIGSSHTIATTSPQSGGTGIQFAFSSWSDGGANSHSITVPSTATTYTASFATQYQLTTAANPTAGGTVSPTSGNFFTSGAVVPLTATANAGFNFVNWTGNVASSTSASTTIPMTAPQSVTANFALIIVAAPTSTSVSSNNNPSFSAAPGNSVTFTATVTSVSTVNEGTVTFSDPANDFTCSGGNTVPVSNGQATCTTSFTTEGSRVVTAAYNGTVNFQGSSGMVTQGVNNHTVVTGNQFCNPGAITVPGTAGAATPYPSNIFVTGLGNIGKVTVALNNISSSDIAQTDLLLIGPTGAKIIPFASVGDGSTIAGVNIVLDDAAASLIPGGSTLVSGTFMPTSITGSTSLVFPAPAPVLSAANYAATDGTATLASTFQGTAANGTWALYAMDNSGNGAATIGGGWCVNITPATVQDTITTSPAGLLVSVDGGAATAAPLVENWIPGSSHTIATTSPQSGGTGVQFVFSSWSDSGAISHSITVPSTATTYTATFNTQFQLTTAANPANGGTVSPTSGAFFNSGTVVPLTATPNTGFAFSSWTGNVASATSASTTINMTAPQSVTANFTATRPMVNLKPISVNFGSVHLSSTHSENITVTNVGSATLIFHKVSLTEAAGNPDSFTFLNSCGSTLAPTDSCTITIGFVANKVGSNSATLNIADNAASSPQHVPLSATVINPRASLNPQSLNFETHKVGSSTVKKVTLTNNGTTMLNIISIAITGADQGDFSQTNACPSSLGAGDKCMISVTFDPQTTGARSAGLTVTDNAVVSSETVTLSGTGD
jgi:hypothetical protein